MLAFHRSLYRLSVGLDICATGIRLLQLGQNKHGIFVTQAAAMPVPSGAMTERKIQQAEVVTAQLRTLAKQTRTKGASVVIAMPVQSVISKKIPLHDEVTHHAINRYFPGVSDVLAYDWIDIDKHKLLIATRQEELAVYVSVVERAGLKVAVVDVDLYALVRAVNFVVAQKNVFYPILLLEYQNTGSQAVMFNKHEVIFHQALYGSIIEIGTQIQTLCKLHGLAEETINGYLLGSAPNVVDFKRYLEESLNVKMQLLNPLDAIAFSVKTIPALESQFSVSCGLALRNLEPC